MFYRLITGAGVATCALSFVPSLALAQTSTATEDKVIITGSRFDASIATAPVNITVIDTEAIRASGASDLGELLTRQPTVAVQDLYGLGATRAGIDLGGFGPTGSLNTLVLLNGRRLNDVDISGANLSAIPLSNIERVELVHGSASVLYGDNATAGVINIVTKSAAAPEPIRAAAELGSFSTTRVSVSGGTAGISGISAFAAADAYSTEGYRDRNAIDHRVLTADISRQHAQWNMGVRLNAAQEELELPGAIDEATFESQPTQPQRTTDHSDEDQYSVELYGASDTAAAELAFRRKEQQAQIFGATDAKLDTLSFTPRINREWGRHHAVGGVDLYHSTLETLADFGAPNISLSDTSRDSYALYAQDQIALTDSTRLTVGGRYQQVDLEVDSTSSGGAAARERDDDLWAWEVTLSQRLHRDLKTYVRGTRSFRFPVLDEIWNYFDGSISLLAPQTGRHVELGAQWQPVNDTRVAVTASRAELEDEIGYDFAAFTNVNLAPTRHDALDVVITSQLTDIWETQLGYAYREATFRSGELAGKHVPQIPEHKVTWTNLLSMGAHNVLGLDVIYTGERVFGNDYTNEAKPMPDYTLVNASLRHTRGAWSLRAKVENVADERIANSGFYNSFAPDPYFYYPLPERAYYVMVEWNSAP